MKHPVVRRSHRFQGITSTLGGGGGGGGGKYVMLKDTTWLPEWGSNPPTSRSVVRGVNHQATAPLSQRFNLTLCTRHLQRILL